MPEPADHPFTCRLRDGGQALVRPIGPDDRWRLTEGLRRLSPQSRYLPFHAAVERLTRYLTEIDYHDHMASVAVDPGHPEEPGIGVARYGERRQRSGILGARARMIVRTLFPTSQPSWASGSHWRRL